MDKLLTLKDGKWNVKERSLLWSQLGSKIFDENLDAFKECAIKVLTEKDPQFDLEAKERYAASIHGKVLSHSNELRKGIAEGIALLGCEPSALVNVSRGKAEAIAILTIREIFKVADWQLWGSLNNLLPVLAEAAPEEFIDAIETDLQKNPCPFDQLFMQEGSDSITGRNYLTGLLWALEGLAWDPTYLSRVCVILGNLADRDPGGKWANRPINSLITIFLPWLPQTIASIEKRKVALQTLVKEVPSVAWKLLLALLPNQHQTSSGTHKPQWRKVIPEDWKKGVSGEEYSKQVSIYAELAIEMAKNDVDKLSDLVNSLHQFSEAVREKILQQIESKNIIELPEEKRLNLWTKLISFVTKHRRFKDAKWALAEDSISKIESAANKLVPSDPSNLYQRLFNERAIDLYDENDGWEKQSRRLSERRDAAITSILERGGVDEVIKFAKNVESPVEVGSSLGEIADSDIDEVLLPKYLSIEDKKLTLFVAGYVWRKYRKLDWKWVDSFDRNKRSIAQIAEFLSFLPFDQGAWERAEKWLGEKEHEYWKKANVHPYHIQGDIQIAIEKLIKYGRPNAALNCIDAIFHTKKMFYRVYAIKALIAALSSDESGHQIDAYHIIEIIKALQNDPETKPEDLFKVEWSYLPVLEREDGISPKTLENSLAADPGFFCEVIRLIYRSKKKEKSEKEASESDKRVASNAWRLLHGWQTVPGTQTDGSFSQDKFKDWLAAVKKSCEVSGHLEVALTHIGQVFFHGPRDHEGLWLDKTIADELNRMDAEKMRHGFVMEARNSRGAHWVDPSGKPERELAKEYRQKANEIENAGFQRFAATIRGLAESYDRDAERVIDEHKKERDD